MTPSQYLVRHSSSYRVARWIQEREPTNATVLLLGDDAIYFYENPTKVSGPFDRKWVVDLTASSAGPGDLAAGLRRRGVRLLCVDLPRMDALDARFGCMSWPSPEVRRHFVDFLRTETRLLHQDENLCVYEMR